MLKLFIFLGLLYGTVFSNVAPDNSECLGKSNGIFVSSSDCSSFFMCSGGFQTVHKCPEPLLFSPNLLVCDWAQNVKCGQLEGVEAGAEETESSGGNASNFDCTDLNSGLYPNPEDCKTFFECSNGDGYIFDCPPGLIFDPTYLICNWPSESNVCRETTSPPATTATTTTERANTTTTELEIPTTELPEEETTQPPQEETTKPAEVTDVTEDNSGESGEDTTQNSVTQTEDDGSSEEGGEESTTESSGEEGEGGETTESSSSSEEETTEEEPTTTVRTTTTTTTTAKPKFCVGKPNGLYPNPEDCTSFYKCTNQYTYLINCPAGNYFDPEKVGCFDDPSVCESRSN